jgi:hypothetical protein
MGKGRKRQEVGGEAAHLRRENHANRSHCPLHTAAGRAIFLNEQPGCGVYT